MIDSENNTQGSKSFKLWEQYSHKYVKSKTYFTNWFFTICQIMEVTAPEKNYYFYGRICIQNLLQKSQLGSKR